VACGEPPHQQVEVEAAETPPLITSVLQRAASIDRAAVYGICIAIFDAKTD
jgi:hypothetical protein